MMIKNFIVIVLLGLLLHIYANQTKYMKCFSGDETEGPPCCVALALPANYTSYCASSDSNNPEYQCTPALCHQHDIMLKADSQEECLNEFLDGTGCKIVSISSCYYYIQQNPTICSATLPKHPMITGKK